MSNDADCEREVLIYLAAVMPFGDPAQLTDEDGLSAGIFAAKVYTGMNRAQRESRALDTSFRLFDEIRKGHL